MYYKTECIVALDGFLIYLNRLYKRSAEVLNKFIKSEHTLLIAYNFIV